MLEHVLVRHVPGHMLGHMLEHVLMHVARQVPRHLLKNVLSHVPEHVLENVPQNRQPDPPSVQVMESPPLLPTLEALLKYTLNSPAL